MLRDEGGLLIPDGVEQKRTVSGRSLDAVAHLFGHDRTADRRLGKKYLALQVDSTEALASSVGPTPVLGAEILESRVSIDFADGSDVLDVWRRTQSTVHTPQPPQAPAGDPSAGFKPFESESVRLVDASSSPIRPAASNPPTPPTASTISTLTESYVNDLSEHPAKWSFDTARALSSHPVHPARDSPPITALPQMPLPTGMKLPSAKKDVEIKHPSPRRFASHPVLLQRASSIASTLHLGSVPDSPGPPPPRSPLRLRRDPRTIENIIACHSYGGGKTTPRLAPSILTAVDYSHDCDLMKPTVITDCTGPIKRPRSRGKDGVTHPAYPTSRKEREERIRARKYRNQTQSTRTIDAVVNAPPPAPRHRLKKARPQIHIPDLRPAPLVTRASSSASSSASWKKITECTRTPVSPVPSQDSPASHGEKTGYTPVSPTTSNENNAEATMSLSPVMLVAEEIPVPKARCTPKPARLVLRDGKTYAPRPRSASLYHTAVKRKSQAAGGVSGSQTSATQTPPRSRSPGTRAEGDETPPLPSPPPNRALPPTPPASGSEKAGKARVAADMKKELPVPPAYEISSSVEKALSPSRRHDAPPHIITQVQPRKGPSSLTKEHHSPKTARIQARLEAVEKQNALLSAALMAVLKTNGALNAAPLVDLAAAATVEPGSESVIIAGGGAASARTSSQLAPAWQIRIARRSAASHAASSSNGSALEMYMSTRRGSKHGC